jgi:hypothetical protein
VDEEEQARHDRDVLLRHAAQRHPDPVLREMAQEITEGRITVEQALQCDAYVDAMAEQWRSAIAEWNAMSDDERDRALDRAEQAEQEFRRAMSELERQ